MDGDEHMIQKAVKLRLIMAFMAVNANMGASLSVKMISSCAMLRNMFDVITWSIVRRK